jgi:hypothetical protein
LLDCLNTSRPTGRFLSVNEGWRKGEKNMAGKKKKFVELEPNLQAFFELTKQMVKAGMSKHGQALVLEMLEYGQRLDAANTLAGDPYINEMDAASQVKDKEFAELERKALEDIKRLAANDDPSISKLAAAAKDYADKEGK